MNASNDFIDHYYQILPQGIDVFLNYIAFGGFCYLVAWGIARLISSEPRKVYVLRLVFMLLFVAAWWSLDFHRGYNGHPDEWGIVVGNIYGMHTIWAWLVVAVAARPKQSNVKTVCKSAS